MSSIPSNTFLEFKRTTRQDGRSTGLWAEIKLMVQSVREAWKPKGENEPVETFMDY